MQGIFLRLFTERTETGNGSGRLPISVAHRSSGQNSEGLMVQAQKLQSFDLWNVEIQELTASAAGSKRTRRMARLVKPRTKSFRYLSETRPSQALTIILQSWSRGFAFTSRWRCKRRCEATTPAVR